MYDNYVWNTDMTSWKLACGKDITERWHMRCLCHYFSLWEITLPRDNASYATVTAKHKTSMAGNSSIIVSLIALSSDRQIPWNAVLQFLEINGLQTMNLLRSSEICTQQEHLHYRQHFLLHPFNITTICLWDQSEHKRYIASVLEK